MLRPSNAIKSGDLQVLKRTCLQNDLSLLMSVFILFCKVLLWLLWYLPNARLGKLLVSAVYYWWAQLVCQLLFSLSYFCFLAISEEDSLQRS